MTRKASERLWQICQVLVVPTIEQVCQSQMGLVFLCQVMRATWECIFQVAREGGPMFFHGPKKGRGIFHLFHEPSASIL
jgi:hypothetical protein